jgi:hypothetical protein
MCRFIFTKLLSPMKNLVTSSTDELGSAFGVWVHGLLKQCHQCSSHSWVSGQLSLHILRSDWFKSNRICQLGTETLNSERYLNTDTLRHEGKTFSIHALPNVSFWLLFSLALQLTHGDNSYCGFVTVSCASWRSKYILSITAIKSGVLCFVAHCCCDELI